MNSSSFGDFQMIFMELSDKFTRVKQYLRGRYSKILTKKLSKAIMVRTKYRNQPMKKKTSEANVKLTSKETIVYLLLKTIWKIY